MTYYPYTKKAIPEHELKLTTEYEMYKSLEKGGWDGLTKEQKKTLNDLMDNHWKACTYQYGLIKVGGWILVMPFINTYWVKTQFDGFFEVKAYNIGMIKRNLIKNRNEIIHIEQVFY